MQARMWTQIPEGVLPDRRLSKRLGKLVDQLAHNPGATVPEGCGPAGAKAAYRFWDNDRRGC